VEPCLELKHASASGGPHNSDAETLLAHDGFQCGIDRLIAFTISPTFNGGSLSDLLASRTFQWPFRFFGEPKLYIRRTYKKEDDLE
jgi:hypothetical protein